MKTSIKRIPKNIVKPFVAPIHPTGLPMSEGVSMTMELRYSTLDSSSGTYSPPMVSSRNFVVSTETEYGVTSGKEFWPDQ